MNRFLLTLLFAAGLLVAQPPLFIQAPECMIAFRLTAAGNSFTEDNRNKGCTAWIIAYNANGFTGLSLTFQSAPDAGDTPGAFVAFAGTIVSGVNPNTAITQALTVFQGYFPWLRANLAGLVGAGTVRGAFYGWRTPPPVTISVGGSIQVEGRAADGAAPVGNPVWIGGFDGVNVQALLTDTSGRLMIIGGAADGAAIAGNPVPTGARDSAGNMVADSVCTLRAKITLTGAGNTQIIAAVGGQIIRVCHLSLGAASALNVKITEGTGVNCVTGLADVSDFYQNITSLALDFAKSPMRSSVGQALCLNQSAAVTTGGIVTYAQY